MKKIPKVICACILALLLSANVTSTLQLSFGGDEVQARHIEDEIVCWSQVKFHLLKTTTLCPTCSAEKYATGDDGKGTCTR